MASAASIGMNTSAHALADLKTYAQSAPDEAASYLQHVADGLRGAGDVAAADTIATMLAATGALVDRIAANAGTLGLVFPEQPNAWGELQAKRANSIGWTAAAPS